MVTIIARPTTTSQAATTIVKNAMTWPCRFPVIFAKVTKARLAALSINSIHIKTTIAFLRTTTPTAPIENRIADKYR
jgi:hypothetical protein